MILATSFAHHVLSLSLEEQVAFIFSLLNITDFETRGCARVSKAAFSGAKLLELHFANGKFVESLIRLDDNSRSPVEKSARHPISNWSLVKTYQFKRPIWRTRVRNCRIISAETTADQPPRKFFRVAVLLKFQPDLSKRAC